MNRVYQLPLGYTVEFRWDGQRLDTEWRPCLPSRDTALKLLLDYRNARNHFLSGLGLDVVVVEL